MSLLPLSRRLLAWIAAPLIAGLVLGLGIAVLPGAPFTPAARAAESADCACEQIGPFVAPDPGVAPAYTRRADNLATSPSGEYEIVVAQTTGTIYRAGDRNRPLTVLPMSGTDRRWGFGPDEDRFLTWTLGAGQMIAWQLYDLSGSTGKVIASDSGVTASSINFAFSANGERLIVGAVQGNTEQRLSVYSARAGGQPLVTDSAPIVFPASDPGGMGGDSGAPSAARNVEATVPKKTTDIEITWDEPYYQGDGAITGYQLLVDPIAPEASQRVDVGARHIRLTGYTPGVKYTFELRIVNRWGKKSAPVEVTAKIPLPKPAPTPTPTPTRPGLAPTEAPTEEPTEEPRDGTDLGTERNEPGDTGQTPPPSTPPSDAPSDSPSATPSDAPSDTPSATPSDGTPSPSTPPTEGTVPGLDAPARPEGAMAATDPVSRTAWVPEPTSATRLSIASALSRTSGTARSAAAADTGATSGWGFSPDARFLLIADSDGTRPRVKMFDLDSGKKTPTFTTSITEPSAQWWFSPCGGVLGILQLSPTFSGSYTLTDNVTGKKVADATRQAKASYGFSVESEGGSIRYVTWADGKGRALATVADCGDPVPPPPPPPAAPTAVAATAAIGRAVVSWQHPATDLDAFEITPIHNGVALAPVTVDGRQRTAVVGSGSVPLASGSYRFRVAAIDDEQRSTDSTPSAAVIVRSGDVCEAGWTTGAAEGTARGDATADGTRASFTYTVAGRTVTFRTATGAASVLDAGWWSSTSYPAGTASRVASVTYPNWGDYLASVTSTAADGSVSIATAVIHVAPKNPPANDAFAKATELTGTAGTFDAETRWSTCEPGEPGGDPAKLTQWFVYQAPDEGALLISDPFSQVNAYLGDTLATLEPAGERHTKYPYSRIQILVDKGDTIALQVIGYAGSSDPLGFTGAWRFSSRPGNDDIAAATLLDPTADAMLTGDLGAAGVQSGEPDACGECGSPTAQSVWYRWTGGSDAYLWFRTYGGTSTIDLFAADPDGEFGIAPVDAIVKPKLGYAGLRQERGREYYLRVSRDESDIALVWDSTYRVAVQTAPENDLLRDAVTIRGAAGEIAGNSLGGYIEAIPPQPSGAEFRSSMVWYEWTAPADGLVSFTVDAETDEIARPEALVFLPGPDGADPILHAPAVLPKPETWRSPRTTFDAEKGQRYLVAVTGIWTTAYSGMTEGDFLLRWGVPTTPGAPADVEASTAGRQGAIDLGWDRPDDGGADITGYRVTAEPALPEGAVVQVNATELSARVFGLTPGVEYELRVAAVNVVGTGAAGTVTAQRPAGGLTLDPLTVSVQPGATLDAQLVARGGTAPYTFSASATGPWITLDPANGRLSGAAPAEEGIVRFVATVRDADGFESRREVAVQVEADEAEPTPIEVEMPEVPPGGWYADDTTVVLTAPDPDAETPVAHSSRGAALAAASAATVHWRTDGAQADEGSAVGRAEVTIRAEGETTLVFWADDPEMARTITIRIDRAAPTVTIASPAEGALYSADAIPAPTFTCSDPLSGVALCEVVPGLLQALQGVVPPEARQLAVRATDHAGNTVVVTRTYRVTDAVTAPPTGRPLLDPSPGVRDAPAMVVASTGADPVIPSVLGILALLVGVALVRGRRHVGPR